MKAGSHSSARLVWMLGVALAARVLIDLLIAGEGYYYGEDPDSFWRLGLSWTWSQAPFFGTYHWVPLQFVVVGTSFIFLRPIANESSMLVPIAWNHAFFLGSVALTYLSGRKLGGPVAGLAAIVVGTTMTEDVWTTFSGLSEPLTVLCASGVGYCLLCYIDLASRDTSRYVIGAGIAAGVGSANHYLGWCLLPVATGLVVFHVSRTMREESARRLRDFAPSAAALLFLSAFPVAWLLSNHLIHADALYFLQKAQTYHPWIAEMGYASRMASVPRGLWGADPALFVVACVAIPLVARQNSKYLILLAPAAASIAALVASSLMGYGAPDMHNRYALVPAWLCLPPIGAFVAHLIESRRPLHALSAITIVGGLAVSGVWRAFGYNNWMDEESRQVAAILDRETRAREAELRVLIESEPCLYPVGGIATSQPRPDWIELRSPEDLLGSDPDDRFVDESADLVVLTNPLSMAALGGRLSTIARVGDYLIGRPAASGRQSRTTQDLPRPWSWRTNDGVHLVEPDGTIYFGFGPAPASAGDAVGIQASLEAVANGCRILRADIQDRYEPESRPWAVVQQLVVNDTVIWSHDLSGDRFCGWQPVDVYLMPTTSRLDVEIRAIAITGPDLPVDWRVLSLTGIRNLAVSGCP